MYSIYALEDPRDATVRYIGLSRNAYRRYAMHLLNTNSEKTKKSTWVQELNSLSIAPTLTILETVTTREEAEQRELHWIAHYLPYGFLTNINKMEKAQDMEWEAAGRGTISFYLEQNMEVSEAQQIITKEGWTPQIKSRRNGIPYLYAARRNRSKTEWRYIGAMSRVKNLTEEKIIASLNKQNKK